MRPIIVAMSKSADFNDRIKVLENGADDFLSEPVNSEEFQVRMNAHLRREFESNLDTNNNYRTKITHFAQLNGSFLITMNGQLYISVSKILRAINKHTQDLHLTSFYKLILQLFALH